MLCRNEMVCECLVTWNIHLKIFGFVLRDFENDGRVNSLYVATDNGDARRKK